MTNKTNTLPHFINIATNRVLTYTEAHDAFTLLFTGQATPVQMGGFLVALAMRGTNVAALVAAAEVMRQHATTISAPAGAMDIVGTGGDQSNTFNISTTTAFVVAACGVPIAKHGNRRVRSKCGAADVLDALGVRTDIVPEQTAALIGDIGIGFMMAPLYHTALAPIMPVRRELGVSTIFNVLGPLTNPAGVRRYLMGAFAQSLLIPMGQALQKLGVDKAWLVYGQDRTDELSICGGSHVVELRGADVLKATTVHPEDAGLPLHPLESLQGGDADTNAAAMRAVLQGDSSDAIAGYRDAVLFNTAAALVVADSVGDLATGVERAREALDSGAAWNKVQALSQATQS